MKNKIYEDFRGYNMKFFEVENFKKEGFGEVAEIYSTINKKGVIRAFHWQGSGDTAQQKIVKPLSGRFNLRVIDKEKREIYEYNNINKDSDPVFVKEGQLLGYLALEDNCIMLYIADNAFMPEYNSGIHPLSYSVDWKPTPGMEILMNERDAKGLLIDDNFKVIVK